MRRPAHTRRVAHANERRPNLSVNADATRRLRRAPDCCIDAFASLQPGDELEPFSLAISAAANDRYWEGAGVDHALRRAGALYPLIAANLTVLTFQQRVPEAMIQTRQHLVCHRRVDAPATLRTRATVVDCFEKRSLPYVTIRGDITTEGEPLWTSTVDFTPAARVGARA